MLLLHLITSCGVGGKQVNFTLSDVVGKRYAVTVFRFNPAVQVQSTLITSTVYQPSAPLSGSTVDQIG
jgi:hypothetical protein